MYSYNCSVKELKQNGVEGSNNICLIQMNINLTYNIDTISAFPFCFLRILLTYTLLALWCHSDSCFPVSLHIYIPRNPSVSPAYVSDICHKISFNIYLSKPTNGYRKYSGCHAAVQDLDMSFHVC